MSLLLLLLAVLLIIGLILYVKSKTNARASLGSINQLEQCTGQEQRLELPMWYDSTVGEFMTKLRLGYPTGSGQARVQTVDAVVDLGSTQLLVASNACDDCRKSDGVWPQGLGQDQGQQRVVRYAGGQSSTVRSTSAYLMDYKTLPRYQQSTETKNLGKQIYFGLITRSTSSSGSLNVMGLGDETEGFLGQLCGEKTVLLDFSGDKLYIGNVDDLLPENIQWIPLDRPNSGIPYVLAPIEDFRVNGVKLDESIEPKYFLIDNGATDSVVPGNLRSYFEKATDVEATFTVNGRPGPVVSFRVPENSIEYDSLPVDRAILLGNQWMRQYKYVVQYDKKRQAFY